MSTMKLEHKTIRWQLTNGWVEVCLHEDGEVTGHFKYGDRYHNTAAIAVERERPWNQTLGEMFFHEAGVEELLGYAMGFDKILDEDVETIRHGCAELLNLRVEEKFNPKDKVLYVPHHANGIWDHEDCERGVVSSVGECMVFVKFDKQVSELGWDGATAQSCDPSTLVKRQS